MEGGSADQVIQGSASLPRFVLQLLCIPMSQVQVAEMLTEQIIHEILASNATEFEGIIDDLAQAAIKRV